MTRMTVEEEGERVDQLFRELFEKISAIRGDGDGNPDLFSKMMALHFGLVLSVTQRECPGCAAVIADICNDTLAELGSPHRLVASGDRGIPPRHLH